MLTEVVISLTDDRPPKGEGPPEADTRDDHTLPDPELIEERPPSHAKNECCVADQLTKDQAWQIDTFKFKRDGLDWILVGPR